MMKKLLVFLSVVMLSSAISIAQPYDMTLSLPDIDVSALNVGDQVVVPLTIDYQEPGSLVAGWQLFVGYDDTYLTYSTTQNYNSLCATGWVVNGQNAQSQWAGVWTDDTFMGVSFPDGSVICEIVFTYQGGLAPGASSPLVWGTSKKVAGNKMAKGETQVIDNVFFMEFDLTLNDGQIVNGGGPSPTDYVWNGSQGNNEFTDPLNWTPNGVPGDDPLDTATIPAGTPLCASSAADHTFASLTIEGPSGGNPAGSVALSALSFHITGDFTNNGFFYMGMDPATNTPASLVVDGNFLGTGLYTYGYYIPQNDADWHAISSPIPINTDGLSVFNGFDGFLNDFYLNEWDEVNNTFNHIEPVGCDQPDFAFGSGNGAFILLDPDYSTTNPCAAVNPATIDYSGGLPQFIEMNGVNSTVNNGDMTYPMTFTAGGSYAGWNLLGNPFPGTFDISATTWDAGVDASVYTFDGSNYISGTSAGVGHYQLAAGEGFFVHTNNAANFNFDKAAVVTATSAVTKSTANILKLRASNNQYEDVAYICLDKNATAGFDSKYDAYKKFTPVDEVPQMYTIGANGTKLSINSFPALEETMPLYFNAKNQASGEYTIEVVESGDFSTVILEDTFTGIMTNLLTDSYTFTYQSSDNDNRFILHFAPLGINEAASNGINIYSNHNNIVVNIDNTDASAIVVYDMLGQEVLRTSAKQGKNILTMSDDNYYLVSVILSDNVVNAKVFVK